MRLDRAIRQRLMLALAMPGAAVCVWTLLYAVGRFPEALFPAPWTVFKALLAEMRNGRLWHDLVASLFRAGVGFELAALLGIPAGIFLGHHARLRAAMIPAINFFRNLSPLAWIPFAVLWFGIGDWPAIFLIFLSAFFPLALTATVAVASVPSVYFQIARDHGIDGWGLIMSVTLPAILPQIITALRLTAGLSWVVLVAAEMIAGRDGLGFAIYDARNGLRIDLVVLGMVVIGLLGVIIDRLLASLTRIPSVRWGYER